MGKVARPLLIEMTGKKYATIENLSSLIAVVWGAVLLNPYVDSFDKNPVLFAPMRQIFHAEWFWGAVYLVLGIVCLYLALTGWEVTAAMILFVYFAFVALLFGIGDPASQALWIYGLIAVFNLAHWRAATWTRYRNG